MRSPRHRSYSRSSSRDRRRRHSRRDSRDRDSRDRRRSPYRRSPRSERDSNKGNNVYIANFPAEVTEADLKALFEAQGTVQDARIIKRYVSQESKGFGFVTFDRVRDAEAAIAALDGSEYKGHTLRVEKAKRSRPRESRRTNGSRGRRNSRDSPRSRSRSY